MFNCIFSAFYSFISYPFFYFILFLYRYLYFIPLPVFIFYSFFFFILFYLLFFHVHCTGLFYSFIFFILFYFCLLFFLVVHCTGVGGTIPRGQSLCESMSLCRCLVFILCMPVCNYTLRLALCAVYDYYLYLSNLFLFSTLLSTLDLSFSII